MSANSENAWKQWGGNNGEKSNNAAKSVSDFFSKNVKLDFFSSAEADDGAPDLEAQSPNEETEETKSFLNSLMSKTGTSGTNIVAKTKDWNKRFKVFVVMILLALMFFSMSFTFMPLIVIRPSKFALSFTLGSVCFMASFAALKGPAAYIRGLLEPKYIVFTAIYFFSLACTLYSCLVLGNYLLVIFSSVFQLVALSWYGLSALPGGTKGLRAFGTMFIKSSKVLLRSCARIATS